jgi:tetratricopeptide (TPR) repeat protein
VVSGATKLIRDKLAAGVDPLYRNELEWELGQALFDASRVQQSRGRTDEAIKLARQSMELLEKAAADRDASETQHYLLGRVCFRLGSYYAVGGSDHQQAIAWYQKSLLHFAEPLPISAESELGLHGERYVSMGASYWKVGQQEAGVKLTEQGVKWIKRAVDDGRTPEQALAIPYGNLAAMHKELGHEAQAEQIANLASRIEADAPMRR